MTYCGEDDAAAWQRSFHNVNVLKLFASFILTNVATVLISWFLALPSTSIDVFRITQWRTATELLFRDANLHRAFLRFCNTERANFAHLPQLGITCNS